MGIGIIPIPLEIAQMVSIINPDCLLAISLSSKQIVMVLT